MSQSLSLSCALGCSQWDVGDLGGLVPQVRDIREVRLKPITRGLCEDPKGACEVWSQWYASDGRQRRCVVLP